MPNSRVANTVLCCVPVDEVLRACTHRRQNKLDAGFVADDDHRQRRKPLPDDRKPLKCRACAHADIAVDQDAFRPELRGQFLDIVDGGIGTHDGRDGLKRQLDPCGEVLVA